MDARTERVSCEKVRNDVGGGGGGVERGKGEKKREGRENFWGFM